MPLTPQKPSAPRPDEGEMQRLLEWLWLEACRCTEETTSEDCPAHEKMELVVSYIRSLESERDGLREENEKMHDYIWHAEYASAATLGASPEEARKHADKFFPRLSSPKQ